MATIANLVVEIGARSKKLHGALKRASIRVANFAKSAAKNLAAIGTVMTVALVGASLLVVRAVNNISAALDTLIKEASSLGIASKALEKLRFQAALAGVSTAELGNSMRQMTRVIGDAKRGSGAAQKTFADLGLSMERILKLPADKQFNTIARALNKVKNSNEQAALANQLFGRNWLKVGNLVRSDMVATGKQFDKMGIGLTKVQDKAIEDFEDAKTVFGTVWDDFLNKVTADVVPAFTAIITHLQKTIVGMGGMGVVAGKVAGGIVSGVIKMVKSFQNLGNTLETVGLRMDKLLLGYDKKVAQLVQTTAALKSAFSGIFGKGDEDLAGVAAATDVLRIDKQVLAINEKIAMLKAKQANKPTSALVQSLQGIKAGITASTAASAAKASSGAGAAQEVKVTFGADEGFWVTKIVKSGEFSFAAEQVFERHTSEAARGASN